MNIDEAISFIKTQKEFWMYIDGGEESSIAKSLEMALSALHAQREWENNEPLTESEIDSIKEAPLYVVPLEKEDALPGWCIYKSKNGLAVFKSKTRFNGMYFFGKKNYGKTWLAYRHPPKEDKADERD